MHCRERHTLVPGLQDHHERQQCGAAQLQSESAKLRPDHTEGESAKCWHLLLPDSAPEHIRGHQGRAGRSFDGRHCAGELHVRPEQFAPARAVMAAVRGTRSGPSAQALGLGLVLSCAFSIKYQIKQKQQKVSKDKLKLHFCLPSVSNMNK